MLGCLGRRPTQLSPGIRCTVGAEEVEPREFAAAGRVGEVGVTAGDFDDEHEYRFAEHD